MKMLVEKLSYLKMEMKELCTWQIATIGFRCYSLLHLMVVCSILQASSLNQRRLYAKRKEQDGIIAHRLSVMIC